ncbi:MAG: hypothetical protein GH149_01585, partial [Methanosarcinales archaeon]|nr:hypothetical protein [Methanosarcinales archaeon]
DKRGFTGLEAAIVLTAFVVVAAVFSYVVLNAGFFTSQKSEEVVHTGIEQVTSSFEPAGDIIGHGWKYNTTAKNQDGNNGTYYNDSDNHLDGTYLTAITIYLTLTAGQMPMDLDKLAISYTDRDVHVGGLNLTNAGHYNSTQGKYTISSTDYNESYVAKGNMSMGNWTYSTADTPGAVHNRMLEAGEKVIVLITLPDYGVTANKPFTIELKPSIGAVITIPRSAPGQIDETVILH